MKRIAQLALALGALMLPAALHAGHSELMVPPADTFLLGGDQDGAIAVSGTNRGEIPVEILSQRKEEETLIATVAPGGTFRHVFAAGETALIRNRSDSKTARLSVDFTGSPASLSMRYAQPQ